MFDGEYLNGKKWNGKGYDNKKNYVYTIINGKGYIKEYNYDGILIFEGEYLNGKRHGKGKEFNEYNELLFEGEYLNGKKWNGKGYDRNGIILYELKLKKEMEKEKNIILMVNQDLKENI